MFLYRQRSKQMFAFVKKSHNIKRTLRIVNHTHGSVTVFAVTVHTDPQSQSPNIRLTVRPIDSKRWGVSTLQPIKLMFIGIRLISLLRKPIVYERLLSVIHGSNSWCPTVKNSQPNNAKYFFLQIKLLVTASTRSTEGK